MKQKETKRSKELSTRKEAILSRYANFCNSCGEPQDTKQIVLWDGLCKDCFDKREKELESLNNVFIYLLRSIASQFSAYVLSLIAIVIAATLVPVSAKLYSGDVSDITLFNRNFILIGFFIFECIALLIVIATGGWVRFLQILDEEFDFKSFGFGIIVATFAIPSIANTVTSTGKMDLMFKLVALGIMFFFIHLHKKWLEKDIYTSEDIKSLRKFFVIIQMLIMYCCCYYQIVHLSVVDANKSTSVHDEYICTNTTKSFFPLRCEKVNYIYLQ